MGIVAVQLSAIVVLAAAAGSVIAHHNVKSSCQSQRKPLSFYPDKERSEEFINILAVSGQREVLIRGCS